MYLHSSDITNCSFSTLHILLNNPYTDILIKHTHIHTYTHTHIHTYTHTHIHTCIHAYQYNTDKNQHYNNNNLIILLLTQLASLYQRATTILYR